MTLVKKLIAQAFLLWPCVIMAQSTDELIRWSSDKKLEWGDYQAQPNARSTTVASTSTLIRFEYEIRQHKLSYTVFCSFSKKKSWVRHKSEYILLHEQGHFDIAEIFTRKLIKALNEYTFNPSSYKTDLKKIHSNVMRDKEKFQNKYDIETDHSRIKEKQMEWLKNITGMLIELEEYSNSRSKSNL